MKPRTWILAGTLEAALLLAGVYFEPTYNVRGHVHGEAFFEGKSTSWWRAELHHWEVTEDTLNWGGWRDRQFHRHSTWLEERRNAWLPKRTEVSDNALIELIDAIRLSQQGPRLLGGDDDAVPVLQALLDDSSPQVRAFARIGLKLEPEAP
jgi:hypothetical protein